MKISEMIKILNKYKKDLGDVYLCVDQKKCKDSYEGEGFNYESISVEVVKMPQMNMDTGKLSKKKYNHLAIYPQSCD